MVWDLFLNSKVLSVIKEWISLILLSGLIQVVKDI